MGNKIPSNNPSTILLTPKTIEQLLEITWPKLQPLIQSATENPVSKIKFNYKTILDNDIVNYGLGAMFGAFIGDALGSFLEFETKVSSKYADQAMEMPGKGRAFPFLLPGQFTDDSQLASHMLKGLLNFDPTKSLKEQESKILTSIAYQYKDWMHQRPFDIGFTTRTALFEIIKLFKDLDMTAISDFDAFYLDNLKPVLQTIAIKNKSSESNGSLMRITPLAFFVSLLMANSKNQQEKSFSHFQNLIRGQINMTHGSQAIFESSQAYVHLLVDLILRGQAKSVKEVYEKFENIYCPEGTEMKDERNKHVSEWIKESKEKPMSAITSMGWAKIAFTYSLINMRKFIEEETKNGQFMNKETFKELIKSVLILGGDTDTNGAIVGGVIGAVVGFKNLPPEYVQKQFNLEMKNIQKCEWLQSRIQYEPRRVFINAIKLVQKFDIVEKQNTQLGLVNQTQKIIESKPQEISQGKDESDRK